MSSVDGQKPKPLNYKPLRRTVNEFMANGIEESRHGAKKHPQIAGLAEIILGFKEAWDPKYFERRFSNKYGRWEYTIRTTGLNGKWFKIAFALDENKKRIKIITRHQDEYKKP
jgi:uncharacterized protein YutD